MGNEPGAFEKRVDEKKNKNNPDTILQLLSKKHTLLGFIEISSNV